MVMLKFKTDFEDVQVVDEHQLSIPIRHYFNFGGEGGARIAVSDFGHSGKSLLMELYLPWGSRRNAFNIRASELVGDELFVREYLYLPSKFKLASPSNKWYELAVLYNDWIEDIPDHLWVGLLLVQKEDDKFYVSLGGQYSNPRDGPAGPVWKTDVVPVDLPLGYWFKLEYYVKLHPTNGVAKVWLNGNLVLQASGVQTKNPLTDKWFTSVAKIYYATDDVSLHQIYVDDLEIHDGVDGKAGVNLLVPLFIVVFALLVALGVKGDG